MQSLIRDEAMSRSIVNRVYYAAHHDAVAFLRQRTQDGGTPNHQAVIDDLEARNEEASDLLGSLFARRKHADYRLHEAWPDNSVEEAWDEVRRLRRCLGVG